MSRWLFVESARLFSCDEVKRKVPGRIKCEGIEA
jgi:hypothetical protein